jgi:hypothetical protein
MNLPDHIDHLDQPRKLGLLPPTENCRLLRAAARSLKSITTIIPRSQWTECDYVTGTPAELRLDQKQFGQCVAGSCAGANALMRFIRTGKITIASMAWIYDRINGSRDNGAVIADALEVMVSTGAPTVDKYPINPQFRGAPPMPAGAVILKEDEAIAIDTPDDVMTAMIVLGGLPQVGINVTQNFENFTSDGVAWGGRAPGGQANHSVFLAGAKHIRGAWCPRLVNDWNHTQWGPFGDGTCYIPLDAIDTGGWLHLSHFDSDDKPPVPAI